MSRVSLSVAELCERLDGRLEGDGARRVSRVATLMEADEQAVSWLANPRLAARLKQTRAAAVIIAPQQAAPHGLTLIRVADPELALNEALLLLGTPPPTVPVGVHPTAVVHPEARLDEGVCVGPLVVVECGARVGANTQLHASVYVGPGAILGRDCVLWPGAVVRDGVRIGDRVVIHPNAVIGADGFGYLFRNGRHVKVPQVGEVVIEDDVEIGAGSMIDRAKAGVTRIGAGTKIDNLVQIGHNVRIGEHCILVAQCGVSGSSELGRGVVLAGQVGIADNVRLADGVLVTAQSGVAGSLGPGMYSGTPAAPHRGAMRAVSLQRRLVELFEEVRQLRRRVSELESAADHPA